MRDYHGGGDGGSAVGASCAECRQIAAACLGHGASGLAEMLYLLAAKPCFQPAADYRYRCGNGAVVTDGLLDHEGSLDVFRVGHTVGNYGALKRDNGFSCVKRGFDFGCDIKIFVHFFISLIFFMRGFIKFQRFCR